MLFRNVLYNNFFIVRKEKKITASRKDYQWSVLKRCPSSKLCDFRITAEFRKLTGIEWHGDAEESLNCVTRWSMCGERLFDRHWWYVRKAGCCNQFAVNWSRCDAFFPLFFFCEVTKRGFGTEESFSRRVCSPARLYCTPAPENLIFSRDDWGYSCPVGFPGLLTRARDFKKGESPR